MQQGYLYVFYKNITFLMIDWFCVYIYVFWSKDT